MLKIAALCAGYGGLEIAVRSILGETEVVALAEYDPDASKVLARHFPAVVNHGDVTAIDWDTFPDADVWTAGFPCQDISNAGPRTGIAGRRSGIWKNIVHGISIKRPQYVFLENVAAIKRRGLDVVVADLAEIGYGLVWTYRRASDDGAPHQRHRWFAIAVPNGPTGEITPRIPAQRTSDHDTLPTPTARDWKGGVSEERSWLGRNPHPLSEVAVLLKTPTANLGSNGSAQDPRKRKAGGHGPTLDDEVSFLLPTPTACDGTMSPGRSEKRKGGDNLRTIAREIGPEALALLPTPTAADGTSGPGRSDNRRFGDNLRTIAPELALLPTPKASDGPHGGPNQRDSSGNWMLPGIAPRLDASWVCVDGRDFGPAIARWEACMDRTAPAPTEIGPRGGRRIASDFAEWMMGLPAGHVTATDGLTSRKAMKIIGNGAVPQQAESAYRVLLDRIGRSE